MMLVRNFYAQCVRNYFYAQRRVMQHIEIFLLQLNDTKKLLNYNANEI